MSKKTNPTLIGAFAVGAIALAAVAVTIFGGSELLARKNIYVSFFEDQVTGLRLGANVLLNGVRVGYVSDIDLLADVETLETRTRVVMEIIPDTWILTRNGQRIDANLESVLSYDQLIYDAGLRAQLAVESFITGQLLVQLELRPETTAVLRGTDPEYPEIPTIPSNIQELLQKVQNWVADFQSSVDFEQLGMNLSGMLSGLDELANSRDLREALAGINALVSDDEIRQLADSLQDTLGELRDAAAEAASLFRDTNQDIDSLLERIEPVAGRLNEALHEAGQTLAAAREQLEGDTDEAYQLQATMRELESAARSMRDFFDYLERNPEALLRGKQP